MSDISPIPNRDAAGDDDAAGIRRLVGYHGHGETVTQKHQNKTTAKHVLPFVNLQVLAAFERRYGEPLFPAALSMIPLLPARPHVPARPLINQFQLSRQFQRWAIAVAFMTGLVVPDILNGITLAQSRPVAAKATSPPPTSGYTELEAEAGLTNGVVSEYSTTLGTPEAESSGRQHVKLTVTGHYVRWAAPIAANSLVIRYSIPEGQSGPISLYVNGELRKTIPLTSQYMYQYDTDGSGKSIYPWSNVEIPGGRVRRWFDETSTLIGAINQGDEIKLQKDEANSASWYDIDLIDLENVPAPLTIPPNFLSVVDFGATGSDATDDTEAFRSCISTAHSTKKSVFVPPGDYYTDFLLLDDVTVRGAGMWYTRMRGMNSRFTGQGNRIKLSDLALFGESTVRNDTNSTEVALSGSWGTDSVIERVWIEHKKCGLWLDSNVPTSGLRVLNCRIRNTFADGINLNMPNSDCIVSGCSLRGTQDDALATWSNNTPINVGAKFVGNLIQLPLLANGIAVYGGKDHTITGNFIYDTIHNGNGILVSTDFGNTPLTGTITVSKNTLNRCGSLGQYDTGYSSGALRVYAKHVGMTEAAIRLEENKIYNSIYSGIQLQGPETISDVKVSNTIISGYGQSGIWMTSNAKGSASITSTTFSDGKEEVRNENPREFTINR